MDRYILINPTTDTDDMLSMPNASNTKLCRIHISYRNLILEDSDYTYFEY